MERLIAKMGINFKNGPTPDRGAVPNPAKRRRHAFSALAFLAVLAVGLLFLLPGGLLQAQDDGTMEYAENGMDPVATYTGIDPEGRMIYWSLLEQLPATVPTVDGMPLVATDFEDQDDFMISADGVLTFEFSPNYEMSTSETTSNVYKVVVVASDDAPGAGTDLNPIKADYHKVTVTVTDMDEDGSISLSAQQPQVGVALTATLTDQDARSTTTRPIANETWKWEQSSAMDGPWSLIPGAGAGDTDAGDGIKASDVYMPAADIVGNYLRVMVTYTDKHGDDKTAMAVSAHMVRAKPAGENASPVFSGTTTDREVDENSLPGTAVGKPVKAGDAGDILTYSLSGTDVDYFSIDRATGQITVKKELNFETEANANCSAGTTCAVIVTATDPWGIPGADATGSATERNVSITIKNMNEAPRMTLGPTRNSKNENEDTDPNADGVQPALSYHVMDVDADDAINWSLMGDDKDAFDITVNTSDTSAPTFAADLMLKETPNYEDPTDTNMDNMYMVTVVATDKKDLTAMRDVVITVKNANDEGNITFSSVQPKVGIPFTATLSDEDVAMGDVKWQWYDANPDTDDDGDVDGDDATTSIAIAKAKSDTYTPKRADLDSNDDGNAIDPITLYVLATYTDSFGSTATTGMAANMVVVNQENRAPEFKLNDKVITATTRMVAENTDAISTDDDATDDPLDNIMAPGDERGKDPVMATDMSGTTADTLTYTLGGRDAAMFRVRSDTGHIEVGTGTKLDYERKNSYMVTVTATDPSLASATIDVTINVTDVNEPPEIAGEDDLTENFGENSTRTIETFRATDPERRPVYWSLGEAGTGNEDLALFSISSAGALTFNDPPDFENPGDSDTNNTYKVIVVASDDAPGVGTPTVSSMKNVTITVTNVSERGSITLNKAYPQVSVPVGATLTDGDRAAGDGAITWQWYKGNTELSDANGASTDTYTPQAEDTPSIKVVATYPAKGDERTVTKSGISVRAAPDNNGAPTFPDSTTERSVDENKPAGTNVGRPITATDPDTIDRSKLTYTLSDNANFTITTSGQLKTKVALDHEPNETLPVTVTATDPSARDGEVIVTVTVNDVNEAPMIAMGPTRALPKPENTATTEAVAVYTANDPDEGAALVWSLTGPDASDFNIGNQDGADPGTLTFKEMPDYEKPAASNNLYRVTVEVSDGRLKATRPMTVMVTDVEEDGKVTLSSVQPKVAIDLTASLKDSDGDVENIEWQWAKTTTGDADDPVNPCPASDAADTWTDIDGAEMATYTPDDDDLHQCLRATASYTDRRGDGKTAMQASDNAVIVNTDNRAPEFKDQPSSLKIAEDAIADTAVGEILAEDPNDDTLTYKLTGDAALFKITNADVANTDVNEEGQITVKTDDTLDYEDKNTYMVTVTATDPNGEMASVDVTIKVTDVDEAPKIITGGLVVRGTSNINYAENGMGMVATYSAAGPDAAAATWSLSGADMDDFDINGGMLTFKASPNYESPMDANTDNIYMVMVNANDGTNDAMKAVTVRVTNEEEMGEVTLWAGTDALTMAPQVGETITGAVMDPDGGATGESWQWAKTMTPDMMASWMDIAGETNAAYTVTEGDTGYYLRVMATYTDAVGTDTAMEYSMPTMMVTAVAEMMGQVTLWAGADPLTMAPQVGDIITGAVMDPDGGVTGETWQWSKTMTPDMMDSWMDITGATDAAYMVTAGDTGYHLRVMATYTDAVGTDTAMEYSMPTMMVTAEAEDTLLNRYDANDDNEIDLDEVFKAIDDYFDYDDRLTLEEVYELVDLYFES